MSKSVEDRLVLLMDKVAALAAVLHRCSQETGGPHGLSLSQCAVLTLLQESPGLTVPQLARQRGHSRQNIQTSTDRMAGMGWVESVANPDHRRSERLQLTRAGHHALNTAKQGLAAWLAELSPSVTSKELQSCISVVERMEGRLGGRTQIQKHLPARVRRTRLKAQEPATVLPPEEAAEPLLEGLPNAAALEEFPVNLL